MGVLIFLTGCENKYEKRGDKYLKDKNYTSALRNYTQAENYGEVSEKFHHKYTQALIEMFKSLVDDSENVELVLNYLEEINQRLQQYKNEQHLKVFIGAASAIAASQIADGDFPLCYEGFKIFSRLNELVDYYGIKNDELFNNLKASEGLFVNRQLKIIKPIKDPVVAEYYLLEAELVVPHNAAVKKSLRRIRKRNKHNFLIWSYDQNGIPDPFPLVDKYVFIPAFRRGEYSLGENNLEGYLQIWNLSGSHVSIAWDDIALVGKKGEELRNGMSSKSCLRLPPDSDCTIGVQFDFDGNFMPDYVKILNKDGQGRKYLGTPDR